MNRHTKIAFFVAPFLFIGGYIASDYYVENKADQNKVFQLLPQGQCDILHQSCILRSGELEVNIVDNKGITTVNTTFPLDKATLFLVDNDKHATEYPLGMLESPYYWRSETPLRQLTSNNNGKYTLRLVAEIKGGKYISEFYTEGVR